MIGGATGFSGHLAQVFPPDDQVDISDIDIVAVHGLDTSSPQTWIAWERDGPPSTRGAEINWLSDKNMLPSVIPNARIWAFNYDTNYHNGGPDIDIPALGEVLARLVIVNRKKASLTSCRPIIFIGSCFGGLIVAQALVKASQPHSPFSDLLKSTVGAVFLASPLRGTPSSKALKWRVFLAGAMGHEVSESLIRDLESNATYLSELTQSLSTIAIQSVPPLQISCFYETKKTQILNAVLNRNITRVFSRYTRVFVTERESACLDGHPAVPLDARHVMMSKYRGPNDGNFQLVSSCIQSTAQNAHHLLNARNSARHEKRIDHFLVPYGRDGNFIKNTKIVNPIVNCMNLSSVHNRIALIGAVGVGKTAIAIEIAYQLIETYPAMAIFWVCGTSRNRFMQSYHNIAETLDLPGRHGPESDIVELVNSWLKRQRKGWALVIDDADDDTFFHTASGASFETLSKTSRALASYLPQCSNGTILVTSRDKTVARSLCGNSNLLLVDTMSKETASSLFKNNLPSDALLEGMGELLTELDYVPLAITQAAAYITSQSINIPSYLSLLRESRMSLLGKDLKDLQRDQSTSNSILAAYTGIFQQVGRRNDRALELLIHIGEMEHQPIAKTVLKSAHARTWTLETFTEALGTLLAFHVVLPTINYEEIYITSLVRVCIREWLGECRNTH